MPSITYNPSVANKIRSKKCPECGGKLTLLMEEDGYLIYSCVKCNTYFALKEETGEVISSDTFHTLYLLMGEGEELIEVAEVKEKEQGEEFDSGLKVHKECPYIEDATIIIPREIYLKIKAMNEIMKSNEWLAFLEFREEEGNRIVVTNMIIPKQKVTSASVDVDKEWSKKYSNVGVIHAHPFSHSSPSFSMVDDTYINVNRTFSIVVSSNNEFKAVVRVKAPCGALLQRSAKVIVETEPEFEQIKEELKKEVEEKVEEETEIYVYRGGRWFGFDW